MPVNTQIILTCARNLYRLCKTRIILIKGYLVCLLFFFISCVYRVTFKKYSPLTCFIPLRKARVAVRYVPFSLYSSKPGLIYLNLDVDAH